MEKLTGTLFDLGPDGLGFIVSEDRKWGFHFDDCGLSLAPTIDAFLQLEGSAVGFTVEGTRIQSIGLLAQATSAS